MRLAVFAAIAAALALPALAQTQSNPVLGAPPTPPSLTSAIDVTEARFGDPEAVARTCDSTPLVRNYCTGKQSCAVPINSATMCPRGDPAPSALKAFQIDYTCGATRKRIVGSQGNLATLTC